MDVYEIAHLLSELDVNARERVDIQNSIHDRLQQNDNDRRWMLERLEVEMITMMDRANVEVMIFTDTDSPIRHSPMIDCLPHPLKSDEPNWIEKIYISERSLYDRGNLMYETHSGIRSKVFALPVIAIKVIAPRMVAYIQNIKMKNGSRN